MSSRSRKYHGGGGRWKAKPTHPSNTEGPSVVGPLIRDNESIDSDEKGERSNVFAPTELAALSPSLYPIGSKFRLTKKDPLRITLIGNFLSNQRDNWNRGRQVQFDSNFERIRNTFEFHTGIRLSYDQRIDKIESDAIRLISAFDPSTPVSLKSKDVHPAALLLVFMHCALPSLIDQLDDALRGEGGLINFKTLCISLMSWITTGKVSESDVVSRVKRVSEDEIRDPIGIIERTILETKDWVVYCPFVGESRAQFKVPTKLFTPTCFELVYFFKKPRVLIDPIDAPEFDDICQTPLTNSPGFRWMRKLLSSEPSVFVHHPSEQFNHVILCFGEGQLDITFKDGSTSRVVVDYGLISIFSNMLSAAHHAAKDGGYCGKSHYYEIFGYFSTWSKLLEKLSGKFLEFCQVVLAAGRLQAGSLSKLKYIPFGSQEVISKAERWRSIYRDSVDYLLAHGDVGKHVLGAVRQGRIPELSDTIEPLEDVKISFPPTKVFFSMSDGRDDSWPELVWRVLCSSGEGGCVLIPNDPWTKKMFNHPYCSDFALSEMAPFLVRELSPNSLVTFDDESPASVSKDVPWKGSGISSDFDIYAHSMKLLSAAERKIASIPDVRYNNCPVTGRPIFGPGGKGYLDGVRVGEASNPGPVVVIVDLDNVNTDLKLLEPCPTVYGFYRMGSGVKIPGFMIPMPSRSMKQESSDFALTWWLAIEHYKGESKEEKERDSYVIISKDKYFLNAPEFTKCQIFSDVVSFITSEVASIMKTTVIIDNGIAMLDGKALERIPDGDFSVVVKKNGQYVMLFDSRNSASESVVEAFIKN